MNTVSTKKDVDEELIVRLDDEAGIRALIGRLPERAAAQVRAMLADRMELASELANDAEAWMTAGCYEVAAQTVHLFAVQGDGALTYFKFTHVTSAWALAAARAVDERVRGMGGVAVRSFDDAPPLAQ